MSKTSVFRGTLLLTTANLAIRCVSMVFQVYLSGRIGAAGLGLMQLISSIGILALTFGASGLRTAAMYLTAEETSRNRQGGVRCAMSWCLRYGFFTSLVAGLLLIRLAPLLAARWIQDTQAVPSLKLIGLFLPITCMTAVMSGYFTACGKIRQMVLIEVSEQVLAVILTVLLLDMWAGSSIERACCAIFGGSAVACSISFFVMYAVYRRDRRAFGPTPKGLRMGQRLLRLCVPLALNGYLRSGLSTLENMLIPRGLRKSGDSGERSMETYGTIHGMVFPVITFASVILYSLSDVLVPELARCRATGNSRRVLHLTDKCLRFGLVFALSTAGLLFCLSEPLGLLLYHSTEAARYIGFFAPLVIILYLDAIVDGMHKGLGQQLHCVRYNTLTSFLDVALIFLLLPRYGIGGYLLSFTVTHLLNFYLSIRRLVQVTAYPLPIGFFCKASSMAALSVAAVRLLDRGGTPELLAALLLGCIYLALFSLLLAVSGTFTGADLRWVLSLLRQRGRLPSQDGAA
ncbi:MAG: oligosaccharide flippase family protein [Oscillospiraceae bacterium]|nr:oligosaccharide flippase family protein [Oscillospiraceae bacterium]